MCELSNDIVLCTDYVGLLFGYVSVDVSVSQKYKMKTAALSSTDEFFSALKAKKVLTSS